MSIATCIGCGCDDHHACQPEGCYWLRVDYAAGVGVCSECNDAVQAWDNGIRVRIQPGMLNAQRPTVRDKDIIKLVSLEIAKQIYKGVVAGDMEEAGEDIAKVLLRHPLDDGYQLAKRLEDECGWFRVDFDIAETLDSAGGMLLSKVREATKVWVERNAIKPKRKVGDIVGIVQRGINYSGEIVRVDEEQADYTVMVPECGHVREGLGTHGFVVHYEDIHELADVPENFNLVAQIGAPGIVVEGGAA